MKAVLEYIRIRNRYAGGDTVTRLLIATFVLAAVLIVADVVLSLPPAVRWLGLGLLGAVSVGFVGRFLRSAARFDQAAAIREIEGKRRDFGQLLRTAEQLDGADTPGISTVFAAAVVRQADERLAGLDVGTLCDWQRLRRLAGGLAGVLLILIACCLLWPDFRTGARRLVRPDQPIGFTHVSAVPGSTEFRHSQPVTVTAELRGRQAETATMHLRGDDADTWQQMPMTAGAEPGRFEFIVRLQTSFDFYVTAGDGQSRTHRVEYVEPPAIDSVSARLVYPAYTRIAPQTVDSGDVRAVVGTEVTMSFRASQLLREVELRLDDEPVPTELHGNVVQAHLVLEPGKRIARLTGTNDKGLPLRANSYSIRGMEDRAPNFAIVEPEGPLTIAHDITVPVRVRATDDYGLALIQLVLRINGIDHVLQSSQYDEHLAFTAHESDTVDFSEYTVAARANIYLFARGTDYLPDRSGPAISDLIPIDIEPLVGPPEEPPGPGGEEEEEEEELTEEERQLAVQLLELDEIVKHQRQLMARSLSLYMGGKPNSEQSASLHDKSRDLATATRLLALHATGSRSSFINVNERVGLKLSGSHIAWGDIDNDGWVDLFDGRTHLSYDGECFATGDGGLGACVHADIDNDNWLDRLGSGKYCLNLQGTGRFACSAFDMPTQSSMSQCFADLDGDGFVDAFIAGGAGNGQLDSVCMNENGDGFSCYPIGGNLYSRGATACDYDEDGDVDVFVSRYWFQPNHLFQNDGAGNLQDVCGYAGVCGAGHTISSAWGDFDNDGHFDIFACNFNHHDFRRSEDAILYRNTGPDRGWRFENIFTFDGGDWQESYASCTLADYDNDGRLDIFISTVYGGDYSRLYHNDGIGTTVSGRTVWKFSNVTTGEGLGLLGPTYQAGWGDYDNDGDMDLVTNGKLFENLGNNNHWLKLRLIGNGQTVNRAAIGAQARIEVPEIGIVARQVSSGVGQGNQNELTLHFGLGAHDSTVEVRIAWPDGTAQTISSEVDRLVVVEQE